MKVLCLDDCRKINEVIDYIIDHYNTPIGEIKKRFGLSNEEYDMISELMMPAMRQYNIAYNFKAKAGSLLNKLKMEKERFEDARNQPGAARDQSGDDSVRRVQVGA